MTSRIAGRLLLVPNALDLGVAGGDIRDAVPDGVLHRAAAIRHWVVEDARSARAFLKRVGAHVPLAAPVQELSIVTLPRPRKGERNGPDRPPWPELLAPARQGHDLGLLSEAGLPAVADPGAELVRAAHDAGLEVQPLAGPSALLLALAASGMDGQNFAFVGYLPQEAMARVARLRELEAQARRHRQTQIFIETPYRNPALAAAAIACLQPSTRLSISCGLTLASGWTRSMSIERWRVAQLPIPDRVPAVFALSAA